MAVYYKFKSARDYDPIPIDGHFISVANLKERIFESKHLGRGTDFDLMVSNSQTHEEYVDEATLIPKNTRVLVRRVPGRPRKPIITQPDEPKMLEDKVEEVPQNHSLAVADSSVMRFPEESEFEEFGNDLYAIPDVHPAQTPNATVNTISTFNADEESKLKALIDTPALQWQQQTQDNNGPGRGFGRGMGGRMMAGRGFGRGGFERKTPPQGYICHRCKVPGHFIQHCPTNGDPTYDIRRVKPPTGIPKSMLMATPDGSYALPSGAVAVLKPNEAAFEKEIEGLPSTRTVTDNIPDELRCPLCKEVMKDAVLTAKCCFSSFCDKCIRDHIISKSMCVCGFANILADDLVPNRTVRETISRMMETTTTSNSENAGSLLPVRDMESARPVSPKVPSPTLSAHKKDPVPHLEHPPEVKENVKKEEVGVEFLDRAVKHAAISEPPRETASAKATSQESAPFPEEEAQGRIPSGEQVKKKKKKKTRLLGSGTVSDVPLRPNPDLENFAGMPFPPSGYNPYFPGAPWGMDGYMAPFPGPMPLMGFPQGPFDVPFGGVMPQDPFAAQSYMNNMMPMIPRRDRLEFGMGTTNKNIGHPAMSRKEYEARKGNLAWRESERENGRVHSRESEHKREKGSDSEKTLRQKAKMVSQGSGDRPGREKNPLRNNSVRDSSRLASPAHISKGKYDQEEVMAAAERKQKASVFSRISFPEAGKESSSKKKKASEPPNGLKEHHESTHRRDERRSAARSSSTGLGKRNTYEYESSEEEYHFKRRPSLSMHEDREKAERHSRGSKEREREWAHDYDHERPSKRSRR